MSAFPCPKCGGHKTIVTDSRPHDGIGPVRRRRKCDCGERFTTMEIESSILNGLAAIAFNLASDLRSPSKGTPDAQQ